MRFSFLFCSIFFHIFAHHVVCVECVWIWKIFISLYLSVAQICTVNFTLADIVNEFTNQKSIIRKLRIMDYCDYNLWKPWFDHLNGTKLVEGKLSMRQFVYCIFTVYRRSCAILYRKKKKFGFPHLPFRQRDVS